MIDFWDKVEHCGSACMSSWRPFASGLPKRVWSSVRVTKLLHFHISLVLLRRDGLKLGAQSSDKSLSLVLIHCIPQSISHMRVSIYKRCFKTVRCKHPMSRADLNTFPVFVHTQYCSRRGKDHFPKLCSCCPSMFYYQWDHPADNWLAVYFTRLQPTEDRCGPRSLTPPAARMAILLYNGGFDLVLSWQPFRKWLT